MAHAAPTADQLLAMLERVPEGFLTVAGIQRRYRRLSRSEIDALVQPPLVLEDDLIRDSRRLSLDAALAMRDWARPDLPGTLDEGRLGKSISTLAALREAQRDALEPEQRVVAERMSDSAGFLSLSELNVSREVLHDLIDQGFIVLLDDDTVYDPLRLSEVSVREALRQAQLQSSLAAVERYLIVQNGHAAPQADIVTLIGEDALRSLLGSGVVSRFSIQTSSPPYSETWVRLKGGSFEEARAAALAASTTPDESWRQAVEQAGDTVRPNARGGAGWREQVLDRSYTLSSAARRLSVRPETIEQGIEHGLFAPFTDPEGSIRIPASTVEHLLTDDAGLRSLHALEQVRVRDLANVVGQPYAKLVRRLKRGGITGGRVAWQRVAGRWGLPMTLPEFHILLQLQRDAEQAEQDSRRQEEAARAETERLRRRELRERLVAAFPMWKREAGVEQQLTLHVGPPNSGKTYESLMALAAADGGWYLAPLRLLAFEVFERLNRMGVRCSLLTGEEHIPVDGSEVTAATIEMFNPGRSGGCVVIDEAQMLADADRGWAWTRALMEAQSPDIHVVAPPFASRLVEQLSEEAGIPVRTVMHERLAPIEIAEQPWKLSQLPPRTILVAFSRQMVLELKNTLEGHGRSTSVVYGSLPPEVRRKQAERFAEGASEICIATDAVGMGLNLPADNVCFFEVHKFDGRNTRPLTASEAQQIGGRAGRFGLSEAGVVGALRRDSLDQLRRLFAQTPAQLTHARVAPTVTDLEMIPGSLSERLAEWASLKSIPPSLRGAIEVAALAERVELARMLSAQDEAVLGLSAAYQLVNAPTRNSSRAYWEQCARAIVRQQPLPPVPLPPGLNLQRADLETLEALIACADVYLWLSQRREFSALAPDAHAVRSSRSEWSESIDRLLLRRIRTRRRSKVEPA